MDTQSAASFAELRRILADFPGPDQESATRAAEREGQLTKPTGALARLEEIAELARRPGRAGIRRPSIIRGWRCSPAIMASRTSASRPTPRK